MACADYQHLLNKELTAEAALNTLRGLRATHPTSVRDEELDILNGRVARANVELMRHVASCPECSKETGEIHNFNKEKTG